jgi:hypothetical protein
MSLALPIARPKVVTAKVKFTPSDFAAPVQCLVLTLRAETPSKASEASVREALAAELGRDLQVLLHTRGSDDLIVFEIPDRESRYTMCTVKGYFKPGNAGWYRDATNVFLLKLPATNPTVQDAEAECVRKLAHIWDEEGEPPAGLSVPQIDRPPPSIVFEEGQRLRAMIFKSNSFREKPASPQVPFTDRKVPSLLFDNHVVVILNPEYPFSRPRLCLNLKSSSAPSTRNAQPPAEKVTLRACFSFHAEPEILDEQNQWYCPRCKTFSCAEKKVDIWKVPEVLVIHLKRYVNGGYHTRKLDTPVDFPEVLHLQEFVEGPEKANNPTYRLFGVSNHMGGMNGGHYTAHCIVQDPRGPPEVPPRWYSFNDSSASLVEPGSWKTESAYLLFYERMSELGNERPRGQNSEDYSEHDKEKRGDS